MSREEKQMTTETTHAEGSKNSKKSKKPPMTPLGKLISFIGSFIIWFVILFCLAMALPRLAGIETYVVVSGSMEPSIPVGSLVYAKETDPKALVAGDVIVFYKSNDISQSGASGVDSGGVVPITHRVVENHPDTGEIITKGDANNQADISPVTYNNVVGKVVFHIRSLGYLAAPLSTVFGKVAIILVLLAAYILTEVANRMRRMR